MARLRAALALTMLVVAACAQAAPTPVLPTLAPSRSIGLPTLAPLGSPTAALGSTAPMAAPTAPSTPTPAARSTVGPTARPTSARTLARSAAPTEPPSAAPSDVPSGAFGFNADEVAILDHVPSDIRPGCVSVDTIYASEVDSVRCDNDGQPEIDYSSFVTPDDMNAEYTTDRNVADDPTTADGQCAQGTYESGYTINAVEAGKLRCMVVTGQQTGTKYKVIEWTNDDLLILSYMSSPTMSWDDLIAFWKDRAGPDQ